MPRAQPLTPERQELAVRLAGEGLDDKKIAMKLGYAHDASFNRAKAKNANLANRMSDARDALLNAEAARLAGIRAGRQSIIKSAVDAVQTLLRQREAGGPFDIDEFNALLRAIPRPEGVLPAEEPARLEVTALRAQWKEPDALPEE